MRQTTEPPVGKHDKIQRVVIVHGWDGSSAIHWQSWLARKCERVLKVETHYPKLPEKHHPVLSAWLEALDRILPVINETTALVGHSMGSIVALQLLLHRRPKVSMLLLVAPSSESRVAASDTARFLLPFYDGLGNIGELKVDIKEAHVWASGNDNWIDPTEAQCLSTRLGAEFHFVSGAGHFNVASGHHTFPDVLALLRTI
jgi:predicted alpha/beta hydrolase family esterase